MSLCSIEENEVSIITPTAIVMENYFGIRGKKKNRKNQQQTQHNDIMKYINEFRGLRLLTSFLESRITVIDKSDNEEYEGKILKHLLLFSINTKKKPSIPEDIRFRIMVEKIDKHILCPISVFERIIKMNVGNEIFKVLVPIKNNNDKMTDEKR